jgi:hypothetical protein
MTAFLRAFRPLDRETRTLAATTASSVDKLRSTTDKIGSRHVRLVNAGNVLAFVRFGVSSPSAVLAATSADIPLPPGITEVLSAPDDATHVAVITASSATTIYVTIGEGI